MVDGKFKGSNRSAVGKLNAMSARIRQMEADNRRLASRPLNDGGILERVPTRKVGVCKIVTNEGAGAYTITELTWNGSSYDAATAGIFQVLARDYRNRDYAVAGSDPIDFWQQNYTDGTPEYLINIGGTGTAGIPQVILPSAFETEAAQNDTWDRDSPAEGKDGVSVRLQTRTAYDDGSDEKLYAYYRTFIFDSAGNLKTISAETRVTVDTPEAC